MSDVDIEDTINRIKNHKSVQGIVIVNHEGTITRTTYLNEKKEEGDNIAKSIPILAQKARSLVRDLDPTNDLAFLRIKSKQNEILIAPDKDLLLIVIQGPKKQGEDDQ
ncbi:unnamed protein product [Paramecium primaurelia]|uniref:Dynein light chain roadblock n=1 Tax=Paramecium primaurelia TaxID=5886 RepID=A0A8S1LE03_PARPR|nr:unnamed protein product [Paramecium primaurelia]